MTQNLRVTADGRLVPDYSGQRRVIRLGHILGPPASAATLSTWLERWPRHPLPPDLKSLVARANGIHLWANLDTGRSPHGIAPLEEWDLARVKMYGEGATHALLADRYLAIHTTRTGPPSSCSMSIQECIISWTPRVRIRQARSVLRWMTFWIGCGPIASEPARTRHPDRRVPDPDVRSLERVVAAVTHGKGGRAPEL